MPTISSGGIMPPPLERRISESTPGAILQPQPPPCEKLVRRSGSASSGTPAEVLAFMGMSNRNLSRPCPILSARAAPRRQQPGDERAHRAALGGRPKQRLARSALGAQRRRERLVGAEAAHQPGESKG